MKKKLHFWSMKQKKGGVMLKLPDMEYLLRGKRGKT